MKIYIVMQNNSRRLSTDKVIVAHEFIGATKYKRDAQLFCAEFNDYLRHKISGLKNRDIRGYGDYYVVETDSEYVNTKITANVCIEYHFMYDLETGERIKYIENGYSLASKEEFVEQKIMNRVLLVLSVDADIPFCTVEKIADSKAEKYFAEKLIQA